MSSDVEINKRTPSVKEQWHIFYIQVRAAITNVVDA